MRSITLKLKDHQTGYVTLIHIDASSYCKATALISKWWKGWEDNIDE